MTIRVLDNSFEVDKNFFDRAAGDPNVKSIVPRLESFALCSAESKTQGVMVLGIDLLGEDEVSGIKQRLIRYRLTPEAIASIKNEKNT